MMIKLNVFGAAILVNALFTGTSPAQSQEGATTPPRTDRVAPAPTIDTDEDGTPDGWDQRGDGRADSWDQDGSVVMSWIGGTNAALPGLYEVKRTKPAATAMVSIDTDEDGTADAWDQSGNGRADSWDLDGDGRPDVFDRDGDGEADEPE